MKNPLPDLTNIPTAKDIEAYRKTSKIISIGMDAFYFALLLGLIILIITSIIDFSFVISVLSAVTLCIFLYLNNLDTIFYNAICKIYYKRLRITKENDLEDISLSQLKNVVSWAEKYPLIKDYVVHPNAINRDLIKAELNLFAKYIEYIELENYKAKEKRQLERLAKEKSALKERLKNS